MPSSTSNAGNQTHGKDSASADILLIGLKTLITSILYGLAKYSTYPYIIHSLRFYTSDISPDLIKRLVALNHYYRINKDK